MYPVKKNIANQILCFRAYNTDNSAKVDLTSATAGLTLTVGRIGLSEVTIVSLSNKAADNTAHADGAIRALSGNIYLIDVPDSCFTSDTPAVSIKGSFTGGYLEGCVHPLINYEPLTDVDETNRNARISAEALQL